MEYATRAGALTSRFYGETDELLPKYARYLKNSQEQAWPVGSLKPNDFGLFDVHGNVWTWCQESSPNFVPLLRNGEVDEDREDNLKVNATISRALRGGSFVYPAFTLRSAARGSNLPGDRFEVFGFRVARTIQ
jgi:formylglycine-generating enzyme required for sulfatase activity